MRKYFKLFEDFHGLDTEIFVTNDEKEVEDIVHQELLTDDTEFIEKENPLFKKMEQIASTSDGEKILELNEHLVTKFDTPFEFIRWDRLGSDKKPLETCFIVKKADKSKI